MKIYEINRTDTRKLSLEMNFMTYQTDDLLLGWMLCLATVDKKEKSYDKCYLRKSVFNKEKKQIADILGMSGKTLSRHIKDLEEKGLLAEREMEISDGKSEMVYYFPTGDIYKIINKEMLYYLISTRNKCAVKVYLFLLNWYQKKAEKNEYFTFTNKDIIRALGYSETSWVASSSISNIIDDLNKRGIIETADYTELFTTPEGKEVPMPKQRLLFVAYTIDDMEEMYIEQARKITAEEEEKEKKQGVVRIIKKG